MSKHDRAEIQAETDQSAHDNAIEEVNCARNQVLSHELDNGKGNGHALQKPYHRGHGN